LFLSGAEPAAMLRGRIGLQDIRVPGSWDCDGYHGLF
jgi:hypothetical protein